PGIFMIPVTMTAGYLNIVTNYWPKQDWLKVGLSATLMILMALVFIEAFRKWFQLLQVKVLVKDQYAELVLAEDDGSPHRRAPRPGSLSSRAAASPGRAAHACRSEAAPPALKG